MTSRHSLLFACILFIGIGLLAPMQATADPAPRFASTISVTPDSLGFGEVEVGQTKDLVITIENTGADTLTGSADEGAIFAQNGFVFVSGSGAFSLAPGATRDLTIRLAPGSVGAKASTVEITHDGTNLATPFSVPLTGEGVAAAGSDPEITVDPTSLAFGEVEVGATKDLVVTIENTGQGTLTGNAAKGEDFNQNGFLFQEGEGAFSLAAGETKDLTIRLMPGSVGPKASTVEITHDGANEASPVSVSLTGQGVEDGGGGEDPAIQVTPTQLAFGSVEVGQTKDLTVSIQNTGQGTLSGDVDEGPIFAQNGFVLVSGGGAYALTAGQSKVVTVRLAPGSVGMKASSLVISHNGTNAGTPVTVDLSGSGVGAGGGTPAIAVDPSSLAFGDVVVGETKNLTLTMSNPGTGVLSGQVNPGPIFAQNGFVLVSGGGTFTLEPGEDREVVVRLAPESAGPKSSTLEITHNASGTASPVSVPLSGEGIGEAPAVGTPALLEPADGANDVGRSPTLRWSSAENATSYVLRVSQQANLGNPFVNVELSDTSRTVAGLDAGETYYWQVLAKRGGVTAASEARSFVTGEPVALTAPELLEPADAAPNVSTTPTFRWRDVDGATGYAFTLSKAADLSNPVAEQTVTDTTLGGFALDPATAYFWRVAATRAGETPVASDVRSFTTSLASTNAPPVAVTDSISTRKNTAFLIEVLQNDTDPDGDGLQLVAIVEAPLNGIANVSGSRIVYIPNADFVGGDRFRYRVSDGRGGEAIGTVVVDVIEGVPNEDAGQPSRFALAQNYPNPFNPATRIGYEVGEAGPVELSVYDVQGRRVAVLVRSVRAAGRYEVVFDARDLPSGVYLYVLRAGTQTFTRTLSLLK